MPLAVTPLGPNMENVRSATSIRILRFLRSLLFQDGMNTMHSQFARVGRLRGDRFCVWFSLTVRRLEGDGDSVINLTWRLETHVKPSHAAWCSTHAENRSPPIQQTNELHRAVVDGAEFYVEQIQGVVLMKLPRPL